jgi:uncharacterized membrane protein
LRKLVVAGILIIALGLVLMASFDPLVRILVFGPPGAGGGTGGGGTFISSGSSPGNFTNGSAGASFSRGSSADFVAVLVGFTAEVLGLILVVVGELTANVRAEKKEAPSAQ